MAETKDLSQDTLKELKDLMDRAKEQDGSLWDVGVSIHRTNAVPLDTSSIVFVDGECEDEDAWVEAAWAAAEAASSNATSHPGQQITVLGKVKDGGSYIGKAISFIIQPSPHSHKDYLLDASDADPKIEYSHETPVQELVYKSYVKKLDAELRHQIGNLSSIMNFYGVFASFSEANNAWKDTNLQPNPYLGKQIKPGDVIVITGTKDPQTGDLPIQNGSTHNQETGKPGMEYVCSGFTDEKQSEPIWVELGFGSQIAYFLGGDKGLTLPDICPGIGKDENKKPTTTLDYIQKADKALASFIGGLDTQSNTFNLPETMPNGSETNTDEIKTILNYIQESDEVITNFIGANNPGSLPTTLYPDETGELGDTEKVDTVLKYIQSSNKLLDQAILEEAKDRADADKAILKYVGHTGDLPSGLAFPKDTELPYPINKDDKGEPTATPKAETVISFIVESDESIKNELENEKQVRSNADAVIAGFIGGFDSDKGSFNLPETMPGGSETDIDTILDYIQKSDNIIADFIRPTDDNSESGSALTVPTTLPDDSTNSATTVVGYIQASDKAITDLIGTHKPEFLPKVLYTDATYPLEEAETDTVLGYIQSSNKSIKVLLDEEAEAREQADLTEEAARIAADNKEAKDRTDADTAILKYIGSSGNLPSDDSASSLALPVDVKLPYPLDAEGATPKANDVISFIVESDKSIKDELENEKQVRNQANQDEAAARNQAIATEKSEREQADQAEKEARINADLAEQVRATNTEASIIAGASFVRTNNNELQWKSETQTLTYNKAVAEISEEGQECIKIEEESITSCNGETYYLVATKKDGSSTSFAEFKLEGNTKIPLRELALFGQEFFSNNSEGCFYIYNSLCYVNEDYSLKEALGTITTTISTDVSENGNAGWWCVSNDTRTVPVDSLLQIMSNVANVRDTLKVVQKEFITIEHEQDSEDTCLCINLNTFTTNINSSY